MLALDTNVLVRFLVEDDRKQAQRARAVLAKAVAGGTQLYLSNIVLCEAVWVLDSAYGFSRSEIAATIDRLLHTRQLTFGSADQLARALAAYSSGKGDFADYVIREEAGDAGCQVVVTFDKTLHSEAGFRAV